MGIDKTKILRPKRMNFQFVEEGKWTRDAENLKLKVCIVFSVDLFKSFLFLVAFIDVPVCVTFYIFDI